MKKFALILIPVFFVASVHAQKETKPWTEWSLKETTRMLNDSPWGQTQLETKEAQSSTSAITSNGSSRSMTPMDPGKDAPGAITSYIKYFVRFLSAKPIRQAVVRKLQLEDPKMDQQRLEQLKSFAENASSDFIVIAVVAEAKDRSMGTAAQQAFSSANISTLNETTFLERKDGQRLKLIDFKPPIADGLGAKFVFPRLLNNQPFITAESGPVRFVSQLSKTVKLDTRFKVSEMIYNGTLEY